MSGHVAIVTDSTAYLPVGRAAQWDIAVVPVQVIIGGTAYDEGSGVGSSVTARRVTRTWPPSGTAPAFPVGHAPSKRR